MNLRDTGRSAPANRYYTSEPVLSASFYGILDAMVALQTAWGEQRARHKRPRAVILREEPLSRNPSCNGLKRARRPWATTEVAGEADWTAR